MLLLRQLQYKSRALLARSDGVYGSRLGLWKALELLLEENGSALFMSRKPALAQMQSRSSMPILLTVRDGYARRQ